MRFLLAILLSFSCARLQPGNASDCRPANAWSRAQVAYFTNIVSGSSADETTLRQAYNLPGVNTIPAVQHILDEADCARAVTALSTIYTDGVNRSPVYVFRIGTTRLAIADGSLSIHIFDTFYKYLVTLGTVD